MSTPFEMAQVVVAIIATVVAAASAVIVAWQAVQTRKSTHAALDAVRIARAELAHSELLRDDAIRARIDAEMPRITISAKLHADVLDPREIPSVLVNGVTDFRERLTQTEYVMPRDAAKQLRVRGTVSITNDGPRHMHANIRRTSDQSARGETIEVAPGATTKVEVSRIETLQTWVNLARWAKGELILDPPHEDRVFVLTYRFPGWIGAVENHEVLMGGTAVEPINGNDSGWRPARLRSSDATAAPVASLEPQPFERLYFRNRPGDEVMGWF